MANVANFRNKQSALLSSLRANMNYHISSRYFTTTLSYAIIMAGFYIQNFTRHLFPVYKH